MNVRRIRRAPIGAEVRRRLAGALLAVLGVVTSAAAADSAAPVGAVSVTTLRQPLHLRLGLADYGQYRPVELERLLGSATGLNLGIVRLTMQWSPGQTRLSAAQEDVVRMARSSGGLEIIYTLSFDRGRDAPTTDESRRRFVAWARDLVAHGAVFVEATNEPMQPLFWSSVDPATQYADLLVGLYSALHSERPDVTVIAGSLARHNARGFMAELTSAVGGKKVADAVSLHYPTSTADYERRVRLLHECFGSDLPVYVSEDGSNLGSEAAQAAQIARKITLAMRERAAGWILLQLQDRRDLGPWHTGLYRSDWARKPTYYAVADAAGRIAFPFRPRRRWDDQVALTA